MWLRIAFFMIDWYLYRLIINDRLRRFLHLFFFRRCLIIQHLMFFRCLIIQHFNFLIRCLIQHFIRDRHFHDRRATARINWSRILYLIARINCCFILHILSEIKLKNHYLKMLLNIAYLFFSSDVYKSFNMHISVVSFFNKLDERHERHTNDENISRIDKFHFNDFIFRFFKHLHSVVIFHFHSIIWDIYSAIRNELYLSHKAILIVRHEIATSWVIYDAFDQEINVSNHCVCEREIWHTTLSLDRRSDFDVDLILLLFRLVSCSQRSNNLFDRWDHLMKNILSCRRLDCVFYSFDFSFYLFWCWFKIW